MLLLPLTETACALVIETSGFHPDTAWRNATEKMRVTERITRIDEDTLEYAEQERDRR